MSSHVHSKGTVIKEVRMLVGNRITIPADVRRALGLKPGDKLRLTPAKHTVTFERVHRTKRQSVSEKTRK